jgi:hypothetical protein
MAITKCRIWLRSVTGITVAPRTLRQGRSTGDGMVRAAWMEKIMSKTTMHNSEARREACEPIRELNEAELNSVCGGKDGKVMHGDIQIVKYLDKAS